MYLTKIVIFCLLGAGKSQELRRLRLPHENEDGSRDMPTPQAAEETEERELFLRFHSKDCGGSSTPPSSSPITPDSKPPSSSPTTPVCDPDCPCCDATVMSEFVDAVQAYTPNKCGGPNCCYYSSSASSERVLLAECGIGPSGYLSAYMSYDYTGGNKYCGCTGAYGLAVIALTDAEAAACDAVVRGRLSIGVTSCTSSFDFCA
jgi:hypothetical protein